MTPLSNYIPKSSKAQQKRNALAVVANAPSKVSGKPPPVVLTKPSRSRDPHATREAENYENPIPSRELILDVLTQTGVPMMEAEIMAALDIGEAEVEGFTRRLNAMERDG